MSLPSWNVVELSVKTSAALAAAAAPGSFCHGRLAIKREAQRPSSPTLHSESHCHGATAISTRSTGTISKNSAPDIGRSLSAGPLLSPVTRNSANKMVVPAADKEKPEPGVAEFR